MGRAPISARNRKKLPIGNYLYNLKDKKVIRSEPSSRSHYQTNSKSERILQRIKVQRFLYLFKALNPNQENQILGKNIARTNLEPQLQELMKPFLEELVELDEPLNFEEFYDSMENLLKLLTPEEKAVFLGRKKQKETPPAKNTNKSLPSPRNNIYERHLERQRQKQLKVETQAKLKEEKELKDCTFQPKIKQFNRNLYYDYSSTSFKSTKCFLDFL